MTGSDFAYTRSRSEVEHELETGEFRAPDPETGEFERVDPPRPAGPS